MTDFELSRRNNKLAQSPISNRDRAIDCIFLFLAALLPFLPAVYRHGFHDDDWQNLGVLVRHSNGTLMEMARALIELDPHFGFRPVQLSFLIADYKIFGLNPTEYYVCLAVIVAFTPITVYLMMLEVPLDRWLAFSTSLIFAFLPHYATDRFWISSQQANLCIAFGCLGLFALFKSTKLEAWQSVVWVAIGTVMIVLSFLSYEVALGLIAVGFIYVGWRMAQDEAFLKSEPRPIHLVRLGNHGAGRIGPDQNSIAKHAGLPSQFQQIDGTHWMGD